MRGGGELSTMSESLCRGVYVRGIKKYFSAMLKSILLLTSYNII